MYSRIPCSFTVTEVSISRQKSRDIGVRRVRVYTPTTALPVGALAFYVGALTCYHCGLIADAGAAAL